MSAATKAAAFAILFRILVVVLPAVESVWQPALVVICIVTMIGGNLAALAQKEVKRMLAYSSVAHAGYLLIAIIAGTQSRGAQALLFYLVVYAATSVGAFAVVAIRERETGDVVTLDSLRGWGFERPLQAAGMSIFLLSLAGFPLTGGFLAKLYLFGVAVDSGYAYLAVIGVVATVISLGYYLRIGLVLFDRDEESHIALGAGPGLGAATIATLAAAIIVVWLGVWPGSVIDALATAGALAP